MSPELQLTEEQTDTIAKIAEKIINLGLEAVFIPPITKGPVVSVYRFRPTGRTRAAQLGSLSDDFAIVLGVESVMVKRMPGESAVGVFVPNRERKFVDFKDALVPVWENRDSFCIPLNFGVTHIGKPFTEDLTDLPHLLVAGSTGSGKSIFLANVIGTIIHCMNSNEIKLVLSDNKHGAEFGHFSGTPHLLYDPAETVYQTLEQMEWVIEEMDDRMKEIANRGYRNIKELHSHHPDTKTEMPFVVLILDELADLLLYKSDKKGESNLVREKLQKIVQKSRATGVHVIAATQRPDVKVVGGTIKANFPARLSLRLPAQQDSRTVLGTGGAENLLSCGDMLYSSPNFPGLQRLHAPWVNLEDIKTVVDLATRKFQMEVNK